MSIDDVTDLTPRIRSIASVAQTDFDYPFPIFADADLVVLVDDVPKTLTTDYTVDGAGDDLGGTITFVDAMSGGEIVTIYRDTVIERTADFQQNGPIASVTTNDELDKLYIIAQELKAKIGRAIRFPFTASQTDAQSELSPLSNWFNKFLYIGSTGLLEAAAAISGVVALTQSLIGQLLYPRTLAEISAGVTPTNYWYVPGDIRRYGAVSDGATDCSAAIQNAITVVQQTVSPRDAGVYIPPSQQGWKLVTGLATVNAAPIRIYGDNAYYSYLFTNADIAMLTVSNMTQYQGVSIENVGFIKATGTPTKAGVHFKNSAYCRMIGCLVQGFFYNVRYEPTVTAPSSCFNCSIEDSTIVGCIGAGSFNIRAEANTNHLNLRNVTCGGTALGGALYLIDSIGLNWVGGDAESCGGPVSVDIDATSDLRMAAKISGVDFEASSNSAGVIRIGNTALVRNVKIDSNGFLNGGASAYLVNPVRCDQLIATNNAANTGVASGFHVNPTGTTQTNFFIKNNTWQTAYAALPYSASMTPHAGVIEVSTVTITNATAFTVNVPDGCATPGQRISVWFINSAGGAHGAGTISAYKGGTFPAIASGNRRLFTWEYDGTNWFEAYRSATDISN